jgi:hypothetical protein
MKHDEYIGADYVSSFANWFPRRIADCSLRHGYLVRGTGRRVVYNGLCGALSAYRWNGESYEENAATLNELRSRLANAMEIEDQGARDSSVRELSVKVLEWGGVVARNRRWLVQNETGLAKRLAEVCTILGAGDDDLAGLPKNTRFNSGMTKIYSLLLPGFVIYDSRVAAALGWFVGEWCQELKRAALPEHLAFPWMPAKEAARCNVPKNRNPSRGPYLFPKLYRPFEFARWNLRASWLLAEVLSRSENSCFHQKADPLRALEAALFAWGYDLG